MGARGNEAGGGRVRDPLGNIPEGRYGYTGAWEGAGNGDVVEGQVRRWESGSGGCLGGTCPSQGGRQHIASAHCCLVEDTDPGP